MRGGRSRTDNPCKHAWFTGFHYIQLGVRLQPLQMGLLLDLNPDDGLDDGGNDAELEAELLQLMGGGARSQGRKSEGKSEEFV